MSLPQRVTLYGPNGQPLVPNAITPDDAGANPTTGEVVADMRLFNGATAQWQRVRGDITAGLLVSLRRATLVQVTQPAANAGATITLAAGGAGIFHFITHIRIERSATAALAGGASLNVTTTNLGGIAWRVGNNMIAGGTQIDVDEDFANPIRSAAANTATTIVLPVPGIAVLWSAWIAYYTSQ